MGGHALLLLALLVTLAQKVTIETGRNRARKSEAGAVRER